MQNYCLNCGEKLEDPKKRFCDNSCAKQYSNVEASKQLHISQQLPQAIIDDIELYADEEGLEFEEGVRDLLLYAIKVRFAQLNLKPVAANTNLSNKSVVDKRREEIEGSGLFDD